MNSDRPRLFVIASYMHAFVVRAPRFPRDGETVFGTDSEIGPGGKGSNQAIAAARLGARVSILAGVGGDTFGDQARALWQAEGIDTELVTVEPGQPSGMAFIMLNAQGQNRIIVNPGANDVLTTDDAEAAAAAIAAADVLVAQFESPVGVVERALAVARRHGVTTILNPAPAREVSNDLLSLVDVLTPNEAEAQALTGLTGDGFDPEVAARRLQQRGVKTVVLTLGEAGAYVLDAGGGRVVPGLRVPVTDTTGAGDAFTGALAVALAGGADIDKAVRFANLGGAFCVTHAGVVPGLGTESDLLALRGMGSSLVP